MVPSKQNLVVAAAAFVLAPLLSDPTSDVSLLLRHLTMQPVTLDREIPPRSDGIVIPRKSAELNDFIRFWRKLVPNSVVDYG